MTAAQPRSHAREAAVALALGVTVVGLAFRVASLHGRLGAIDGDEAVVGLMTRHLLRGNADTFFWKQAYGGSVSTFLAAPLFVLFGAKPVVLKLVPLGLDAAAVVLTGIIGRRIAGRPAGYAAAALLWVWPASYVWWSTKERMLYWPCLVAGLVVLLAALRVRDGRGGRATALLLGVAAGVGWWVGPFIVYFVVPAAYVLIRAGRRSLAAVPVAAVGAIVGAAPWLAWNVNHQWASLDSPVQPVQQGYFGHLSTFFAKSLPIALGLKVPYSEHWIVSSIGPVALVVAIAGLAVAAWRHPAPVVPIALVAYPVLYGISPSSWYVGEARYLLFLAPIVVLTAAPFLRRAGAAVAVVVAVALTASGLASMRTTVSPNAPDRPVPVSTADLVRALERQGWDRVFADYWLAYRVEFESRERLTMTPAVSGAVRYKPYDRAVRSAERPVYAFVEGSTTELGFRDALTAAGVSYERIAPRGFVVYRPSRRVLPEELPVAARP